MKDINDKKEVIPTNIHTLRLERDKTLRDIRKYRSSIGHSIFGDALVKVLIKNREALIKIIDEMIRRKSEVVDSNSFKC